VVPIAAPRDLGVVVLGVRADADHLHVLRAVAASAAARLPMSLDDIDDLRLAVDEAAARLLLLPGGARLSLEVGASSEGLDIAISTDADPARWPEPDVRSTLPWKILAALTDQVAFERRDGSARIRFRKRVTVLEVRA
jgi:serine/threonine-protein kinase RsbW